MEDTKHIRHTSVTVEQYLQDWPANARTKPLASFWGTDSTNYCNKSYGPYMQQRNNDGHSDDSYNDKTLSVEPQQDDAGVDNPTVHQVEKQEGIKNADMPHSKPHSRPKVIHMRSE